MFDIFFNIIDNKSVKNTLEKMNEKLRRKCIMYMFNRITVNPQLPKRINRLSEIANNLWWTWNSEYLRLFKNIDIDLWETIGKNSVKFLKLVSQEKLEAAARK